MNSINTAITRMMLGVSNLRTRLTEERGQDLLEYALLGGLIAVALIGFGVLFTPFLADMARNIGACIDFDTIGTTCSP